MRKRDTRSLKMDKNDMEITKKGKGRGRNGRTRTINNDLEGPITFSGTRTGKVQVQGKSKDGQNTTGFDKDGDEDRER